MSIIENGQTSADVSALATTNPNPTNSSFMIAQQ